MTIFRDDGDWEKSPLGIKNGDLLSWRKMMFKSCPKPEVGFVVVPIKHGKIKEFGYRCLESKGYDSCWERVKYKGNVKVPENVIFGAIVNDKLVEFIEETESGIPCTTEGVYLGDGVYISPEDCWF